MRSVSKKATAKGRHRPPAKLGAFAQELADGLDDALCHIRGSKSSARVTTVDFPDPPPRYTARDVLRMRRRLGMTQVVFAKLMNVSVKSVEAWEAGTKSPGSATRRLLQIASDADALQSLVNATSGRFATK